MPVTQRDVVDETFANCGLEGSKSNQVQVSGIGVNGVNRTVSNENYLAVSTIIPAVAMQVQTNSCVLSWNGISGVAYQPLYSTNLVDWTPLVTLQRTNADTNVLSYADAAATNNAASAIELGSVSLTASMTSSTSMPRSIW